MDFFSLAPVDLEFLRRKQPADNLIPPDMTQITIIIQKVILLKNNPWAASKCTNETKPRTERFDKQRRHSGTNKAWTEVQDGGSHIWNEHNTSENLFLLLFLGEGEDSCFVLFFLVHLGSYNRYSINFPGHWPGYLNSLYNKVHSKLQKFNKTLRLNKFPFHLTSWEVQPGLWFVTAFPCDVGLITL